MDHDERYIQRYNDGWKLEFQNRDKIELPKVEELILSTNVECQPADAGGKLMHGDRMSVTFGELKLKVCTVKLFKIKVDKNEIESIPHQNSPESSDTVTVHLFTPGENRKPTNPVIVKPYECLICQKSFSQSNHLYNHARSHTRKLNICTKSRVGKNKVYLQQRNPGREKSHVCNFCQKLFLQSNHLKNYARSHERKSNMYTQPLSDGNKEIAAAVDHQSENRTPLKPYKCSICLKSFVQSNHLKNHTRISHEMKSNFRAKSFTVENYVIPASENSKLPDPLVFKPHKCLTCRSFLHSNHLKNHMKSYERKKSNIYKKPYSCKNNRSPDIKGHYVRKQLPTHAGKRPYKCTICQKSFAQLGNLRTHLRTHTGDKPYKCSFCVKSFSISSNMKVYERVHTGDKPYQCIVCTKSFSQLGSMQAHERIHRGEGGYQCSICGEFFSLSSLRIHLRAHTEEELTAFKTTNLFNVQRKISKPPPTTSSNSLPVNQPNSTVLKSPTKRREKPYACPICSKLFSQSIHLSQHMKIHAVEKPYQCPNCPRAFTCQNVLKRHLGIHKLLSWKRNENNVSA